MRRPNRIPTKKYRAVIESLPIPNMNVTIEPVHFRLINWRAHLDRSGESDESREQADIRMRTLLRDTHLVYVGKGSIVLHRPTCLDVPDILNEINNTASSRWKRKSWSNG